MLNDYPQCLLVDELLQREEIFREDTSDIVCGCDDLWQTDVVEMHPYTRFNRSYHYILTVVDVLSKHGPNRSKPRAGTK